MQQHSGIVSKSYTRHFQGRWIMIPLTMVCIAALILLRDVAGMEIGRPVFIGLAVLACLFSDKAGIYCLIAFLAPLATGISATYIVGIALIILLIKQRQIHSRTVGLICMAAILFIELFSAFRGMFSLMNYMRFTAVFLFTFLSMIDLKNDYNNKGMLNSYIIGFWVAIASVFGQMLKEYSLLQILGMNIRLGNTRSMFDFSTEGFIISYNPNGLGTLCLLATMFSLIMYKKTKQKLYVLSFVFASILGIMTQSRAFAVAYVVGIFLFTVLSCNSLKSAAKSIAALIAGGAVVIGGAMWAIPEYVNTLLRRFTVDDISNGREYIAEFYYDNIYQHIDRFFVGVGLQNYPEKYHFTMSAHNATQEVLIAWGIIGLIIVLVLFVLVVRNGYLHNSKAKLIQYLPLAMYLLAVQSGQGFSNISSMLLIMVAYNAILIELSDSSSTPLLRNRLPQAWQKG